MRTTALALLGLAVVGAIAMERWNRQLEAAVALPAPTLRRHPSIPGSLAPKPVPFKRIPLVIELPYVAIGLTTSVARTIKGLLDGRSSS
jgi:hypothetical protein